MTERIPAFSVRLGAPNVGYSPQRFEERKRSIRNLLELLMPATKSLIFSVLEEEVIGDEKEILLNFFLTKPFQGVLDFDGGIQDAESRDNHEGLLAKFYRDLICLKESALCSRLTIAELSELIIAIVGGDPRAEKPRVEAEDKYELIRSLLKHHQKPFQLCFPDEEILFQLPLIPKFQADPIGRIVEAKIISLTSLSAKIRVLDDAVLSEKKQSDQFRHGRNRTEFRLLRPGRADKVLLGQQLQFAMDTDTRLTMQVRIAREVVTGQVSHLELCAILNAGDVRDGLGY